MLGANIHIANTIASENLMWGIGTFALDSVVVETYIRRMSYNTTLIVKLPEELKDAIREAARKEYMSDSEYTRRALVEKLERNGNTK